MARDIAVSSVTEFEAMCTDLARHGFFAEFIEYLDGGDNTDPAIDPYENFRNWTGAIHAGIDALGHNPEVDSNRIALMGFSQGAYLAVGTAAMYPHQVAAVVEYYGGMIPTLRDQAATMPPTLILHGEADTVIPVSEAHELDELLAKAGRPHEMHIYAGMDHGFNFHGRGGHYDPKASDDAWHRAIDFLARTLKSHSHTSSWGSPDGALVALWLCDQRAIREGVTAREPPSSRSRWPSPCIPSRASRRLLAAIAKPRAAGLPHTA